MRLSSAAFSDRSDIPRRYTCDGEDLSPPLEWSEPPEDTRSFVLLCNDPDAPFGTLHHWVVYDLPANLRPLAEGVGQQAERHSFRQAINDYQRLPAIPPCTASLPLLPACALDRSSGDGQEPVLSRGRARHENMYSLRRPSSAYISGSHARSMLENTTEGAVDHRWNVDRVKDRVARSRDDRVASVVLREIWRIEPARRCC